MVWGRVKALFGPSLDKTRISTFLKGRNGLFKESAIWYSIDTRIKLTDADCSRLYDSICASFILSL